MGLRERCVKFLTGLSLVEDPASVILFTVFAFAGQWITTEDGTRVCRLTQDLQTFKVLSHGFCDDWQPGYQRLQNGMTFPFSEGWVRRLPLSTIQLHIENKWVP